MRERGGRYYIRYYDPTRTPSQIERALRTADKKAAQHLFSIRKLAYFDGEKEYLSPMQSPGTWMTRTSG
jgi:hypothetical protein